MKFSKTHIEDIIAFHLIDSGELSGEYELSTENDNKKLQFNWQRNGTFLEIIKK